MIKNTKSSLSIFNELINNEIFKQKLFHQDLHPASS